MLIVPLGRGPGPATASRLRHLPAELLLLRPQPLEGGDGTTTPLVGRLKPVDELLGAAPTSLSGTDAVWVVTQQPRVDHPVRVVNLAIGPPPGITRWAVPAGQSREATNTLP
jgi:hypothetical protein